MLQEHREIIISNLSLLVEETDLSALVPELLRRGVFNDQILNRILNPGHDVKRQKTDLYVEILRRGPQAFEKLRDSLLSTNHTALAQILMNPVNSDHLRRSSSLNSVGSNMNSSDDSDGPCLSSQSKTSGDLGGSQVPGGFLQPIGANSIARQANERPSKIPDAFDFPSTCPLPSANYNKVFVPPAYANEILDTSMKLPEAFITEDYRLAIRKKFEPVNVVYSKEWKVEGVGKPRIYKMDSNPRGCALLVNNMKFNDSENFPDRTGSDNDLWRLCVLLKKLHFSVQVEQNKTKLQMEEIVKKFSQKDELNHVDCIWVTFMSHGQEGVTPEDSEIMGTDGIGYKTSDIVSAFYNDNCKALMGKAKIFPFQACRGDLCDPGVLLGNLDISHRIETDGRRVRNPIPVRVRTQEDIFIAYPTPGGITANRDRITGTWFIQAIVDVFSQYACSAHLEDLFKMVDEKIKSMNNFHTVNFQSVTTKTIGWSKNLYFNPGLWKDTNGDTIRMVPDSDEGMDVVDSSTTTDSDKNANGTIYARLKDYKDDEDSDHGGKYDCFNFHSCRTS